jgi:hypothetical protein
VGDAARLRATIRDDAFITLGDDAGDEGIAIAVNAAAKAEVLLDNNTFVTVTGNGVRMSAGGQAVLHAVLTDNYFSEVNTMSTGAAILADQAAGSAAAVNLRLDGNDVFDNVDQAYALHQRGSGAFRLEGSAATAQEQIEQSNSGAPVTVTGTVSLIAAGTLDATLPLTLGDKVWLDDGDGVQDEGELGVSGVVMHLSGVEAAGGVMVGRTTQSDSSGRYLFPGLAPGQYTLTVDVPFVMRLTTADQGVDDALDSDFAAVSAQATVILAAAADELTVDAGLWRTWQNPRNPLDVDGDGVVIPLDVLILINDINARQSRPLPIPPLPPSEPPPYLDVNGSGDITPQDVLIVVNHLNNASIGGAGEGEGIQSADEFTKAFPRLCFGLDWKMHFSIIKDR